MGAFVLRCSKCGKLYPEDALRCSGDDALLRSVYSSRTLSLADLPGMWRFLEWLPVSRPIKGLDGGPVAYRSEALAGELGLKDLYISFNGYWPEKGAASMTCSFKDLEAAPTVERLIERGRKDILVVSSAGNTARAFAHASAISGYPIVLVVPSTAAERLWLPGDDPEASSIFTVAVKGDYCDAITFGEKLSVIPGFIPEGGAKNIARRDGMGTVMLDAAVRMKHLPAHYFQAVGSGTGGIAAWEASMRLINDGRYGDRAPVLHLAQNLPCAPIIFCRSWYLMRP